MNQKNDPPISNARTIKLSNLLDALLCGEESLTLQNHVLFLEAIFIQPVPVTCISNVLSSPTGIKLIQSAMQFDKSISFLNGVATTFLNYLQSPELTTINEGQLIDPILQGIAEPPTFWPAFVQAFLADNLQERAQQSFAWLLLRLISLPGNEASPYLGTAQDPKVIDTLMNSLYLNVRTISYKIKIIVDTSNVASPNGRLFLPGGRHDNDFEDFRKIAIVPTADEIVSAVPPFLRPSVALEDPDNKEACMATYLDNQFRLLREDMIYELREESQIMFGQKKSKRKPLVLEGLVLLDLYCGLENKRRQWGLKFECKQGIPRLTSLKPHRRKQFLQENRRFLSHQSLTCLIFDGEPVAFPTIDRDEDLLCRSPPVIILQFGGKASTINTLQKLKTAKSIKLIQSDTALFSYEPVLKALQETKKMPLSSELLFWNKDDELKPPRNQPFDVILSLKTNPYMDLRTLIAVPQSIILDKSQADSLLSGLTQRVSLIQGPPGTGKSFIGALLAKILHSFTSHIILVVCYTNHALDQFLEDLLDIGIPSKSMVRLGGKSTTRTSCLALQKQGHAGSPWGKPDWKEIDDAKQKTEQYYKDFEVAFRGYKPTTVGSEDLLVHLEFKYPKYFEAFKVPRSEDGMTRVGKKGRGVRPNYLFDRWTRGQDAGMFKNHSRQQAPQIWQMDLPSRQTQVARWKTEILRETIAHLYQKAEKYNKTQCLIDRKYAENTIAILRSKRIIGCTTTAAAKYALELQEASPGVLLVEEAGEILESHILTALGPNTGQLILIGDHKQLRPKVNNYQLTVEKGEGFDLNRSLFERLYLKGYPHQTLTKQHRMRPEISALIRELSYPELLDANKTQGRPKLCGVQDVIVFVNHQVPEDHDNVPGFVERRDLGSTTSKQNTHEAEMILKIVRYLAQQGYGTKDIVVLTPYLGQLNKLRNMLSKDNDPVLNDLDSHDLVQAGLLPRASAQVSKKPIRLATIDNYQGEESDIVLISLTRSNPSHDIGFMSSPERLNVLLSRARNALLLIGNADTFINSHKGHELWTRLFGMLKQAGHIYDGFPIQCERHPDRKALLCRPEDFNRQCPDGGCTEPCGTILKCGVHPCPSKCHQLVDHSKIRCMHIVRFKCPKGHDHSYECHQGLPTTCHKCERDAKLEEDKRKAALALQRKRDAEQLRYEQRLGELEKRIALEQQTVRDAQIAEERQLVIRQKEKDLKEAAARAAQATSTICTSGTSNSPYSSAGSVRHINTIRPSDGASDPTSNALTNRTAPQTSSKDTPDQLISEHASIPTVESTPPRSTDPVKKNRFPPLAPSESKIEWQRQKELEGARDDAIDAIMEMIGLEEVKAKVLAIKDKIDLTKRQGTSLKDERLNVVMLGNPGTGKTTVARLYAKFLASIGVLPGDAFVETTGSRLANDGVPGIKKQVEEILNAGGGALFVDEAYQLVSEHNYQGSQVLDFLLAEMENNVGKIVFILAGYNKQMEKFFEHNPGLISRVPHRLQFADYTRPEFLSMLEQLIIKRFGGRMNVEDGIRGLYGRIVIDRMSRGRGQDGFGNARTLQNVFQKILDCQAKRIKKERRNGLKPDDFLLLKEDLIGPDPSKVLVQSSAWKKLQELIGLSEVKESIRNLFDLIEMNYQRELAEMEPLQMCLNRVFHGSPGTGKTTVAKLYGQILAELGLLSNGEVVVKNPADFIGSALGQSERNTKAILATTVGKILIIDEAYMLYGGGADKGNGSDIYKTAVIDTIVAEVQSVPGEDRCVLLLGYKDQMVEMFQNVNPGLARRFAIENAFHFEDFTDAQLLEILNLKLKDQDLEATDIAKSVAIEVLNRARNRPNFGNGGEVENLLGLAKSRYQTRRKSLPVKQRAFDVVFEPQDFDPDFDRANRASSNLKKLFEDVVGCEEIIKKLDGFQHIASVMKKRGQDSRDFIPTNFVFKGPPGTGKTTIARKMGQVYYDMGFLSSSEVIECSASDLVGQYVGHTGPKAKKLFEKALGRVLFIDEAYRLGEGHFAQEAVDEMVGMLTQEKFKSKIVVILAGYDQEMNKLMAVNTGLSSRFPEEIVLKNFPPEKCLEVLNKELRKMNVLVAELEDQSCVEYQTMEDIVQLLSTLPSWGNARDMITLSKQMASQAIQASKDRPADTQLSFTGKDAIECMKAMLSDRQDRSTNLPIGSRLKSVDIPQIKSLPASPPPIAAAHVTKTAPVTAQQKTSTPKNQEAGPNPRSPTSPPQADVRDVGVSDEIWRQLQADKQAAELATEQTKAIIQKLASDMQRAQAREKAKQLEARKLAEAQAKDAAQQAELKRKQERAIAAQRERERITAELARRRQEEERKKQQEAIVQAKLRSMGVCVAGYQWIKQASGYRCAGGSHFVSDAQLGLV